MKTDSGLNEQETKRQVFISYSRKDINFARRLAGDLEKAGFDVWWDISDLKGGDDWVRNIPTAIEASQYFVVLLSPDSVQSEWVTKEYTYAIYKRLKIIPAMIRQCNIPFALNTINYVSFTTDDYETGLKNLLTPLGGTLPVDMEFSWNEKLLKKLPRAIFKYPATWIITALLALMALFFALRSCQPTPPPTPLPPLPSDTATATVPSPTDTPTSTSTQTFTPTITYTPTITRTKTPIPVNFVLPTVCVQPAGDVFAVNVRTGPGTDNAVLPDVLPMAVGKCPYIGGHNEEDTWFMIAYEQPEEEFQPYEGGWIRKDLFDLNTPVFVPEVTLTSTPTITPSPTITPTFTVTSTPTSTRTFTVTPSPTSTRTPTYTPTNTFTPTTTDSPTPTFTASPTQETEPTVTP